MGNKTVEATYYCDSDRIEFSGKFDKNKNYCMRIFRIADKEKIEAGYQSTRIGNLDFNEAGLSGHADFDVVDRGADFEIREIESNTIIASGEIKKENDDPKRKNYSEKNIDVPTKVGDARFASATDGKDETKNATGTKKKEDKK